MGCVYLVTNTKNGKEYVGQTTQRLSKRWKDHCSSAFRQHGCPLLSRAIRKYGKAAFTVEVLYEADNVFDLLVMERHFIKMRRTLQEGYNLTEGGEHFQMTAETRAKVSRALKGRPTSPEHRANLSKALLGKTPSAETREKIRKKLLGRDKGKIISKETREKLRIANSGRPITAAAREKMRAAKLGRPGPRKSEEAKRKLSASSRKTKRRPARLRLLLILLKRLAQLHE